MSKAPNLLPSVCTYSFIIKHLEKFLSILKDTYIQEYPSYERRGDLTHTLRMEGNYAYL